MESAKPSGSMSIGAWSDFAGATRSRVVDLIFSNLFNLCAVAGAVLPGVNPVTGAVVGAILGGVAGAVIKGKQYYRDTRGYCYYVDQYGRPVYDYNVRC